MSVYADADPVTPTDLVMPELTAITSGEAWELLDTSLLGSPVQNWTTRRGGEASQLIPSRRSAWRMPPRFFVRWFERITGGTSERSARPIQR